MPPLIARQLRIQTATANGNGIETPTVGFGTASFQVSGVFVATVYFEGTVNGLDFIPLQMTPVGSRAPVSSTSVPGAFHTPCTMLREIRARVGNYVSGTVIVDAQAVENPMGETGPPGPTGPAGGATYYVHTQAVPSATWVIVHNLGYRPGGLHVEDSAFNEVEGDIVHDSVNQMTLIFSAAFSGVAYLS